jgi:UDP-N-acetyl-D-mannosaminuronate dehydrogenase
VTSGVRDGRAGPEGAGVSTEPVDDSVICVVGGGYVGLVTAVSAQYTLVWTKEIGAPASPISLTVVANGRRQQVSGDLDMDRTWTVVTG